MAKNPVELSVSVYCARMMLPQVASLRKAAQNTLRRKNTDDIHDLRVATRRIRTCLNLFSDFIPARKNKGWGKDIKSVTQSYGKVRDLDVQIDLLNSLYKANQEKNLLAGIRRLRLRLRQKRATSELDTRALTTALIKSPTLVEMEAWAESLIDTGNSEAGNFTELFQVAYTQIQSRLDELLFFEVFIFDPERKSELHQMRIAAKHLRYALEIFSELYTGKTDFALDVSRQIQQILGEIHDADVWIDFLPKFMVREQEKIFNFYGYSSPFNRIKAGIESVLVNRIAERNRLYTKFLSDWKEWKLKETWLNLRKIIFLTSLEPQEDAKAGDDVISIDNKTLNQSTGTP